ncbi:MAG: MAPEG family protein [Phenylobacterium sp.]|jgi:uncharacterized MAPEG superfamily protein|uniref:MAPEG family protein n=1 Tax=Phenylobacterium sp. TaxID=1871053 RepID=UPI0039188B9B
MTPAIELYLLAVAVVIGLVQLAWAAVAARRQQDLKWATGPRDEPMPITGVAARLDRSFRNFMETFPLHAAAVIVAYLSARLGDLTVIGSVLYVAARALHPVLYALGVSYLRTLAWLAGFVGTLLVLAAIFL